MSLFTNVPKELILQDIDTNWESIENVCSISKKYFIECITLILDCNYCVFNGKFYSQSFGSSMGSALSPVLANRVMDMLLKQVINTLSFEIPFLKRFVDDLILAVSENKIEETLTSFNKYNKHIQFYCGKKKRIIVFLSWTHW